MKKSSTLFGKLLVIFFGAGILIVISIMVSFHFFAEKPYRKSFNRNIVTYTRLIADKMRFDPSAKRKIEESASVKIFNGRRFPQIIHKKNLHFRPIASNISVTKPGSRFYVKYDDGFDRFIIEVKDQHFHPDNIDAIIIALVISILILLFTYHQVQRIFRPIDRIQKMAKEYGKGHFDQKLEVIGSGQIAQLTVSINELVDRIKHMLNSKRDLFLAIAHELKTPLARMRLQAEMMEGDNTLFVENINEMTAIIDKLLEAERVTHHSELNCEETDLKQFIEKFSNEKIQVFAHDECRANIDLIRMDLAITNIINNSKKYAPESEKIDLILTSNEGEAQITIVDKGPGVDQDVLEHLTDAFYRPDTARTRNTGGVGLGLYLVKNIVDAHGGKIEFKNTSSGFSVCITLQRIVS